MPAPALSAAIIPAVLLSSLLAGPAAPADLAPPVINWKSDHQQFVTYVDRRTHRQMLMMKVTGHAMVWADVPTRAGTTDFYEIHADSIDIIPSATGGTLAEATATGAVRLVARTPLTDGAGHAAGVRELVVTGTAAHYDGIRQVAEVTGDPHMEVFDPQLVGPMTLTDATRVTVDLAGQTFDVSGGGGKQPTVRFEPRSGAAGAPALGATPVGPGHGSG